MEPNNVFEPVYQLWDYYDGPRSGIASVRGETCHFSCEWDHEANDWSERFTLRKLDSETLILAEELWTMWLAWEAAFKRGEVPATTHPSAHPASAALDAKVAASPCVGVSRAVFRVIASDPEKTPGTMRNLEVEWELAPTPHQPSAASS